MLTWCIIYVLNAHRQLLKLQFFNWLGSTALSSKAKVKSGKDIQGGFHGADAENCDINYEINEASDWSTDFLGEEKDPTGVEFDEEYDNFDSSYNMYGEKNGENIDLNSSSSVPLKQKYIYR